MRRFLAKLVVAVGLISGLCTLDPGAARQGQNNLGGLGRLGHGGTGLGRLGTDNVKRNNPTPPVGAFAIGGTLSGMENNFPALPVAAEFTYLHNKSLTSVRLPIEWSDVNGQEGAPIGFQPTPFGALETTSTYLNAPLTGPNFLYQSQAPVPTVVATQAPYIWQTFTSGTGTASGAAATAPDGTNTAAQISLNRSDTSSYAVYYQYFTSPTLGPLTAGIWLKGCSGADVGKVVTFNFNPASAGSDNVGLTNITLTGTWTQYSTTASIPANLVAFQIGYNGAFGSGSTGAACMSVWAPQVNAGSSLGTYVPTSGGYVQAVDNLIATAATNSLDVILDYHDFGFGPGLAGVFQISSLTASGTTVTATAAASANLVNGANVVISTGAPQDGYNGSYNIFNVTPTTFQYTLAGAPSVSPASGTSLWGGEHAELGTTRLPVSAFADLWSKTAAHYKTTTNIRYDLMNEPVNGFDSTVWFNAAQAAITAIRATGDTHVIYVEGVNFAGAWNWVSGQGQSFNNANLYLLNDPLNNLIFSAHSYLDPDSSGTKYVSSQVFGQPSVAPTGIDVTPTIGVTRLTPFVQWCAQHQLRCHLGETGFSNDPLRLPDGSPGGVLNSAPWNLAMFNELTFAQQNNVEVNIFAGGPGFGPATPYAGYPYNYEPSNVIDPTQKDFTSTGLQSTQMVIIDKFSGFSGAQPLAYSFTLPVDGSFNPIRYGSVGVASGNFLLTYNAKITSPITVTPHATLMDGTSGGGTFTPATVTFQPGDNATATVTYTPSQVATFQIGAANNGGLIDPPLLGYASSTDIFAGTNAKNLYGMFRQVGPYIGPAYKIQRLTDSAQQDFSFNNAGNLPRQSIQNFLSGRTGKIVIEYDQSGAGNHKVPCQVSSGSCVGSMANPPTFTLVNAAGYPEKTIASGQTMVANSPSNGQGQQSILARVSASNAGLLISQDIFSGNFRQTATSLYSVSPNNPSLTASVSTGSNTGTFGSIAGTFSNLYSTNNVNGYRNGTLIQSASSAPFTFNPFNGAQETDFYTFRFSPLPFVGSTYYEDITYTELSAGTIAAQATADAAYYSTALPDALTAAPPTVIGVAPNTAFTVVPNTPFSAVAIRDDNSGSPTDTVVLTLSGAVGTLSGSGITGSNPYTIAAASAASVTTTLEALTLNTSATVGSVINVTIAVTSSAGTSSSPVMPITVQAYQAETPFAAPIGTFTPVSATPQASKGYNFSGMENGTRSNALIFGPSPYMIDYLAGKGFSNFRLPFKSQWTYPTAFGLLDPTFMAAIKSVADYAFTKNIYVILDPHDFGNVWDGSVNNVIPVTSANPRSVALFTDYWRRLATKYINYPNIIFGLENEPAVGGVSAVQWRDGGVIPAGQAIRATGATQLITIPGVAFTGAQSWTLSGNASAFAGFSSFTNFVFEMHAYLDSGSQGASPIATSNGSTQLDISPNGLANTWLAANGFQAVIYEFGVAPDPYHAQDPTKCYVGNVQTGASAPCTAPAAAGNLLSYDPTTGVNVTTNSITQNGNMLTYMQSHAAQFPGWSAWSGGYNFGTPPTNAGYGYNPEPQRNGGINTGYVIPTIDQQQMGLLTSFLP